jgi:predicted lipoprotein with Yx(FWY)xxD motif
MKKFIGFSIAAALLAMLVFAGAAFAEHHAVKIAKKDGVGNYLVDIKGMTLYLFKMDTPGKSACEGGCLEKWPVYYQETVAPKDGLDAGDFGTILRADGKKQTVYKGHPLYYFAGDKAGGETKGQGIKDVWFVVNP